jgi:hypothetical protein
MYCLQNCLLKTRPRCQGSCPFLDRAVCESSVRGPAKIDFPFLGAMVRDSCEDHVFKNVDGSVSDNFRVGSERYEPRLHRRAIADDIPAPIVIVPGANCDAGYF